MSANMCLLHNRAGITMEILNNNDSLTHLNSTSSGIDPVVVIHISNVERHQWSLWIKYLYY